MEGKVFPAPAVAEILNEEYVEARLHYDAGPRPDEIKQLQLDMTGSRANPIYVIYDPLAKRKLHQREGFVLESDFVEFLKQK